MKIRTFYITTIIMLCSITSKADTLRIYTVAYSFEQATYKLFYADKVYIINPDLEQKFYYIDIVVSDTIQVGDRIDLSIYRKGRFSFGYRNTYTEVFYDSNRLFCVLWKSYKIKSKFSFINIWVDDPMLVYARAEFWEANFFDPKYAWSVIL